jgi:hypothetical protein
MSTAARWRSRADGCSPLAAILIIMTVRYLIALYVLPKLP